ncbi:MAG TPA: NAD(P)-dependent glycerol-1-phosphate dehydrogenase [Candidatus Bathyarchaeia archaeon]|nr:NAD(P)-dependent glycerol-1-phosphate dehydrogenase [Candidatus Bathyarchaeia archaeon]
MLKNISSGEHNRDTTFIERALGKRVSDVQVAQKVHRMELPREVLIGSNILPLVGPALKKLGFASTAVTFTGSITRKVAAEPVADSMRENGIGTTFELVGGSSTEDLTLAQDAIREIRPEVALAVGGGRVIDITKLASFNENIPFISIPTTASHDGIASPWASIKGLEKPFSIRAQAPLAIIADIAKINEAPYRFTESGCGDIISKYTAVRDWRLVHKLRDEYYGDYAANLALMSAKLIMKNTDIIRRNNEEGVQIVLEALISCGVAMSIAGSSRPCSGSEHLFSHALDIAASRPALHGEQCGVGTIMMAYLYGADWKMIRDSLKALGAPTNAKELQTEPEFIIQALTQAHLIRRERFTILGENGLSRDAAEKLARATGVIE